MERPPHPFAFFDQLVWLDGRPLMATIEAYRRKIFEDALYTFDPDGAPRHTMALCGRAKKNHKTSDLVFAAMYRFIAWPSAQGNDVFLLANDEGQAADDLSLVKKLVAANPVLAAEVNIRQKEIVRTDGRGALQILPARDAIGAHGETFIFAGFDEIHGYRTHDLFEALAPDPTRRDVLTWITSYAGIRHAPGIPLYDLMQAGKRGDDPRMYFSWYGGDWTTDPTAAELDPEHRANPSMASWGNPDYLEQQRRRLPSHKYRRLHLNLPGAPDGAALSGDHVMAAIVTGRKSLPPTPGVRYFGYVDMSGGSSDDAVVAIAHRDEARKVVVLDRIESQSGPVPFNPQAAVRKFVGVLRNYGLARVTGDAYAGQTFRAAFAELGVVYDLAEHTTSQHYEMLEPRLNAGEVELLDVPKLQEQLLTLVWRGARIDHLPGDHDDWACAAAGAVQMAAAQRAAPWTFSAADVRRIAIAGQQQRAALTARRRI